MSRQMSATSTVVRCDDLLTADMDDDLVMMSLKSNNYYSLDSVGKAIWAHLHDPVSIADLVARLTTDFEVEESQCLEDVLGLLTELEAEGLVRIVR